MASFFVLLTVSGSAVAVYPPNSGYSSAEAPYFDLKLQFLVYSCCHGTRDTGPKVVLYSVLWGKYG